MVKVSKAAFDQLKEDFKLTPKYSRVRKWEQETLPLCKEQGFRFSPAQIRSIENLVY
jgi:hypothetical protein